MSADTSQSLSAAPKARKYVRMPEGLSDILSLIRKGKLFAVQEWLQGNGYIFAPQGNWSPLQLAVKTGFHSMVEVLLAAGPTQKEKDHALWQAVDQERLDLIELLITNGAEPKELPSWQICANSSEISLFLADHGADLIRRMPILAALKDGQRGALQVGKKYRGTSPAVQFQLDEALRHYIGKRDAMWVGLLLSAGADPHGKSDGYISPLHVAMLEAGGGIFARMKKYLQESDLHEILPSLCCEGRIDLVREFIKEGSGSKQTT